MRTFLAAMGAASTLHSAALTQDDPWKAPPPPWEGTWQGTIGALPVHVCLNSTPYMNQGAYYYDARKKLIRLDLDEKGQDWLEGALDKKNGARLKLAVKGNALSGSWMDGRRSLPVQLRRIGGASQEFEGPCSSMEFHRPRVSPARLKSRAGTQDGTKFTAWSFAPGPPFDEIEVSTFTLDRSDAGVPKVNALLRQVLPKPDGTGDWLDCMASNANAHASDGDYLESIKPTLITKRWLSAKHHSDSYCGGNHPNTTNMFRTFDLENGVEVDPRDWFGPSAVTVTHYQPGDEPAKTLTKAFRAMILRGWKPDDPDCKDAVAGQEFWNVGISRGAMIFSPDLPRVAMACSEEFKVPFLQLQPWLSAKGKAAVASLPR